MKILKTKGQIVSNLQGFIMAIVTIGVILAIGLYVLQEMQYATSGTTSSTYTQASSTVASNATGSVITKLATAPTWIGLLIVVVFASAILAYFYFRQ